MKSGYKNHHILKKNRLEKLQQTKGKCEICQDDAYIVHHIDGSKDNHVISNLAVLCSKHHSIVHRIDQVVQTKNTSKNIRKYGMSLKEMSDRLGLPITYIHLKLKTDKKIILEKLGITEKENTFE